MQNDRFNWSPHTANVFRRLISFVPASVVEGTTTLNRVADPVSITAAGQWAFEASTGRLFVRMLGNTDPADFSPFIEALETRPLTNIPNNDQGWGRIRLGNILLQSPASDRGPGIYSDQKHAFTASGQEFQITVAPVDPARPLRITLIWSDAAGAAFANPALVNDLDLEVTEEATGSIFMGNEFDAGFSTTGGFFDNRNTVECVYIRQPSGQYQVRVIASATTRAWSFPAAPSSRRSRVSR